MDNNCTTETDVDVGYTMLSDGREYLKGCGSNINMNIMQSNAGYSVADKIATFRCWFIYLNIPQF